MEVIRLDSDFFWGTNLRVKLENINVSSCPIFFLEFYHFENLSVISIYVLFLHRLSNKYMYNV